MGSSRSATSCRSAYLLWVADFTYVSTWADFVYVAFVIDAFASQMVGWCVSHRAEAGLVLDALERALHKRSQLIVVALFSIATVAANTFR